jgi:hypothetical protein
MQATHLFVTNSTLFIGLAPEKEENLFIFSPRSDRLVWRSWMKDDEFSREGFERRVWRTQKPTIEIE